MNARILRQIIQQRVNVAPDDDALILLSEAHPPLHVTNRQLHHDALCCANAFHKQGISAGDKVLLVFGHSYDMVQSFWGLVYLGAIPSIFAYFTPNTSPEAYMQRIRKLVSDAKIGAIITTERWSGSLVEILPNHTIFSIKTALAHTTASEHILQSTMLRPEDPAILQFSSGTTGKPKGVLLSNKAIFNNVAALLVATEASSDDVAIIWAPPFHDMGLISGYIMPFLAGSLVVLISPLHWIKSPAILFQAIEKYGGTYSWMPNFAFDLCVRRVHDREIEGIDLSNIRYLGNASEPVRVKTLERFVNRFAPYGFQLSQILTAYGMAENVVIIASTKPGTPPPIDIISTRALLDGRAIKANPDSPDAVSYVGSGKAVPNTEMIIAGDGITPLPDRHTGEILIRSNSLFEGYYLRPDLTRDAMQEGWLRTGDIGYLVDGELYICERKKDLIIVGGRNIYPDSIEAVAQEVLGLRGARVVAFGVYDEQIGTEVPTLLCELRGSVEENEQERLLQTIRQNVVKRIDVALGDVRFVKKGSIKRTTSGKLARRINRDHYVATMFTPKVIEWDGDFRRYVTSLLERMLDIRPIDPTANLFELGIDSLRLAQLLTQIEEQTGQPIPVSHFLIQPTTNQLVDLLETKTPDNKQVEIDVPAKVQKPQHKRRNLRQQIRHSYLHGIGNFKLPYGIMIKLIWRLGGLRRVNKRLLRPERKILHSWARRVGREQDEFDFQRSIASNAWQGWCLEAFDETETFKKWVVFEGKEHVDRALAQGQGLILVHHHAGLRKLLHLLPEHIAPDKSNFIIGLGNKHLLAQGGEGARLIKLKRAGKINDKEYAAGQLYWAERSLKQGGLVQIMGDGRQGSGGIELSFFGRKRLFLKGFAQLATICQAPAIPTFITLQPSGHIQVKFLPALQSDAVEQTTQIDDLVQQYVTLLANYWQTHLEDVSWDHLRKEEKMYMTVEKSKGK